MYRNISIACLRVAAFGCEHDLNPELSAQVDDAIKAIEQFNGVIDRSPDSLRLAANNVVDKLKFEGKDLLAHESREFVDHTLGSSRVVFSGQVEFCDRKLKKEAIERRSPVRTAR